MLSADEYFTFVTRIILAFGIAFVLPLLLVGLNLAGLVSAVTLAKGWRIAVFTCFLFAAIASPAPDAGSMLALAFPMVALYVVALWRGLAGRPAAGAPGAGLRRRPAGGVSRGLSLAVNPRAGGGRGATVGLAVLQRLRSAHADVRVLLGDGQAALATGWRTRSRPAPTPWCWSAATGWFTSA